MFAESLTVRILADTSSFRSDLDSVLSLLDRLRDSVKAVADGGSLLVASFSQLSRAVTPLQQISKALSAIQQQIQSIIQTPLTINVDLALAALAQLSAMIDVVAAKLSGLSAVGGPGGGGPIGGGPGLPPGGFNPFVAGPLPPLPGKFSLDQSSASPSAAAANAGAAAALDPRAAANPHAAAATDSRAAAVNARTAANVSTTSTTNHFGGITIQVRETADVNALVRDLRLQGIHLRNRRG